MGLENLQKRASRVLEGDFGLPNQEEKPREKNETSCEEKIINSNQFFFHSSFMLMINTLGLFLFSLMN